MRRRKNGFTLIEVVFFIAITGLLFVGIIVGTQNSLWQQKYSDAVQSFTSFLRNIYSEVSDTQGVGDGRSEKAIYGKLISFGQKVDLEGNNIPDDTQMIYVYDVIGDASGAGTGSIGETLASLNASIIKVTEQDGIKKYDLVGIIESYNPIWGSVIETENPKTLYNSAILVVRHPRSGVVNTLVSDDADLHNINKWLNSVDKQDDLAALISKLLSEGRFNIEEVNFCLNPYGLNSSGTLRRDIRLVENARSASGVEIVDLNTSNDKCE